MIDIINYNDYNISVYICTCIFHVIKCYNIISHYINIKSFSIIFYSIVLRLLFDNVLQYFLQLHNILYLLCVIFDM